MKAWDSGKRERYEHTVFEIEIAAEASVLEQPWHVYIPTATAARHIFLPAAVKLKRTNTHPFFFLSALFGLNIT